MANGSIQTHYSIIYGAFMTCFAFETISACESIKSSFKN